MRDFHSIKKSWEEGGGSKGNFPLEETVQVSYSLDAPPLTDTELLEMALFLVIPGQDNTVFAKNLLRRFCNFSALLSAEESLILEEAGEEIRVVHLIRFLREIHLRALKSKIVERPILSCWEDVLTYCSQSMSYSLREETRVLFLDMRHHLLEDEVLAVGTVNYTPLSPRRVVERALMVGATAIILVHNHPSGDPTPSDADVELTRQLNEVTDFLGITLYDHLIIGKGKHASMKSLGLF